MDVGFLHVPGIVLRLLCVLCGLCVRVRNFHAKLAKVAKEDAKKSVPENVGDPRGSEVWSFWVL